MFPVNKNGPKKEQKNLDIRRPTGLLILKAHRHGGDPFVGQVDNLAVMSQNVGQGSVHAGSHGGDW